MTLVVRAFPLRGSMSDLAAFASQLNGILAKEVSQFYRHYGVEYESWQRSDQVDNAIAISAER
jgi:hypothetical protein